VACVVPNWPIISVSCLETNRTQSVLPSILECVNKDKRKVQFVKNKNTSGGARQAGSGHERWRRIPVLDQGKQRAGQKAAWSCLSPRTV